MKAEILPQLYNKIRYIFLVLLFPPQFFFQCFPGSFFRNHVLFTWLVHLYTYLQRTSLQKSKVFIKPWQTRRPYRPTETNGVHKPPSEAKAALATFFFGKVWWGCGVGWRPALPLSGLVSITLAKLWPSARIVALEPAPSSFRYLLWNLRENNVTSQAHWVKLESSETKKHMDENCMVD